MKKRVRLSPVWFLVMALSMVTSAAGQEGRKTPATNRLKPTTPANIAAKPDLKIEEAWLAKEGLSAASGLDVRLAGRVPLGAKIRLACKLTNAGSDLKTPFAVTYLVDGKVVGTEQIRGLAAGRTVLSAVAYKTQAAGAHRLRCEADREKKIVETTRDNNALEIPFTVADGTAPENAVTVVNRGETKRSTLANPVNPAGSTTPGQGPTQIKDDRTPGVRGRESGRPGFTPGGTPSQPAGTPYPPNEAPFASALVSAPTDPLSQPEVTTALINELIVTPGDELVVVTAGSVLTLLRAADLSRLTSEAVNGLVKDRTTTVKLDDGSAATFVATTGCYLWRFDTRNLHLGWERSLMRPGIASDQLVARPVVHLLSKASANYKAAHPIDMVYVPTAYDNEDSVGSIHSRVYALDAASGIPVWIFNGEGNPAVVGPMVSAGSLDTANDMLFIGTLRPLGLGEPQSTVWAIDVLTGYRVWSADCGSIENSPALLDDRVLVASWDGFVSALDRSTGGLIWRLKIGPPYHPSIAKMTAATVPNIGRAVFLVTLDGGICLVKDNGNSSEVLWSISLPGGKKAKSHAVYEPDSHMLYVGADDSQVYQVDALSGTVTANRFIEMSGTGIIGDPFIWKAGGVTKLIAGSSTGTIAEFVLPWPKETFGQ